MLGKVVMHLLHGLSRAIVGKEHGSRKLNYYQVRTCRPTRDRWQAFLAQPGPEGSLQAQAVDFEAQVHSFKHSAPPKLIECAEIWERATDDLQYIYIYMCRCVKHAAKYKYLSQHYCPLEVRWLLFYQNSRREAQFSNASVGFSHEQFCNPRFFAVFTQSLVHMGKCEAAPMIWHQSEGIQLDKGNGAMAETSIRIVHDFGPIGKAFFKV